MGILTIAFQVLLEIEVSTPRGRPILKTFFLPLRRKVSYCPDLNKKKN